MRTRSLGLSVLLCAMLLSGCDKPVSEPPVGTSKAEASTAASSALDAARAAAVNTGEALKDTAIAAKHEADAAVAQTQAAASSADLQGSMHRLGSQAKEAVDVAADKTRALAEDAKEKVDNGSSSSSR